LVAVVGKRGRFGPDERRIGGETEELGKRKVGEILGHADEAAGGELAPGDLDLNRDEQGRRIGGGREIGGASSRTRLVSAPSASYSGWKVSTNARTQSRKRLWTSGSVMLRPPARSRGGSSPRERPSVASATNTRERLFPRN